MPGREGIPGIEAIQCLQEADVFHCLFLHGTRILSIQLGAFISGILASALDYGCRSGWCNAAADVSADVEPDGLPARRHAGVGTSCLDLAGVDFLVLLHTTAG